MKPKVARLVHYLAASGAITMVWILASQFAVRPLIVKAYHGLSHPFFNQIISGQARHDVDHYLQYWSYVSQLATIGILAVGAALYLAKPSPLQSGLPLLDRLAGCNTLSVAQSIKFAVSLSAVAGGFSLLSSLLSTGLGGDRLIDEVTRERGGIQSATFGFLALGLVFATGIVFLHERQRRDFLLISFLMLLYTCRELDFPIMLRMGRPTDKWEPFFLGSSSLFSKIWFTLLIVATGLAIISLIWRKSVFHALKRRDAWAIYGLVWGIMLALTQIIDKSPIGMDLQYAAFEETFELFASVICFLSVYSLAHRELRGPSETTG